MNDTIYIGEEARKRLIAGVKKTADAVRVTMGTGGSNSIIEAIESPGHLLTNDGWTIANSIKLADPIEEMGRKILLEAINRANKQSGDGSSTTCLLTAEILEEGMKHLGEATPMEIKKSLEECLPIIEKALNDQKIDIKIEDIGKVATISAEDPEIGIMIQNIYQQIGKDGIIYWDVSKTGKDHYTIGKGITVEGAGYASPYMCDATENGQNTNQIRIKNPKILITKQKLSSAADFEKIGSTLFEKEIKDLVVFCDDFDPLIMTDLIKTRMMRGFRFVVVKMPVLFKDHWFEDLSIATGATVIDLASGVTMRTATMAHLGTVEDILITKTDTYLDGIKDVSNHLKSLADQKDDGADLRITRLNTKTARYFVGAHSDSALSYRRLKVEDAIAASYQALQNGVVAGGGVSLRNCEKDLPMTVGGKIMMMVCYAPIKQIVLNCGLSWESSPLLEERMGFNSRTGEAVDMIEAGIIDPLNVELNACRNAISVAAAILTASSVVTLPRE